MSAQVHNVIAQEKHSFISFSVQTFISNQLNELINDDGLGWNV